MTIRAKFTVSKVSEMGYQGADGKPFVIPCYDANSKPTDIPCREIAMMAVYDLGIIAENKSFSTATPTGSITFTLNNAALAEEFKPGTTYYVDFTPAEK